MSTGGTGGGTGSAGLIPSVGAPPGKTVPRDILAMQSMLKEMGIHVFDVRILSQMLEFVYRYVTGVTEEARVYSLYGKKKSIDTEDVKLAVKVLAGKSYSTVPPRDTLLELAKVKNSVPLPVIKPTTGLRLPPDRFCLTQPNYQLQFNRKAVAGSTILGSSRYLTTTQPGFPSVFKTPTGPPLPRSSQSPGEPDPKKFKLMS